MTIIRQNYIKREDLRNNPDKFYLFGDNCFRKGLGGQAAEMRGEPNAIGIITKKRPTHGKDAYFTQADWIKDSDVLKSMIDEDFARIPNDATVVIPTAGLGTGLARLDKTCPSMLQYINSKIENLSIDSKLCE